MSIDRLNSAAWAAGFAMAPTEADAPEAPAVEMDAADTERVASRWRSANVLALPAEQSILGGIGGMRQWFASWQRKATA